MLSNKMTIFGTDAKERIKSFHGTKREWGFEQLVSLQVLKDGYLVDDCCIFGAEVSVFEQTGNGESVSVVKDLLNKNTFIWNIQNFSNLHNEFYKSNVFAIGGHKWALELYPDGNSSVAKGKSLSLFLSLEDAEALKPQQRLCVQYMLRVRNQLPGKDYEGRGNRQFSASTSNWGFFELIPLSKLKDTSEGYIVNGCLIIEVQILLMAMVEDFS